MSDAIDPSALDALLARARREVDDGLLPSCQVAVARHGEVVALETFGDAGDSSRYVIFSCTKALIAGAVWLLLADGSLVLDQPVGRPDPRVRRQRQGRGHRRAAARPPERVPHRAARPGHHAHPASSGSSASVRGA